MTIGYARAKALMVQLDWKMLITLDENLGIQKAQLYHPKQKEIYTVRKDSGKQLLVECRVCGRKNDQTAILCYNHDGADENLI